MSARDDLNHAMETAFGIEPHETAAFFDAYRDEVLREAAAKQWDHAEEEWSGSDARMILRRRVTRYLADMIDPDKQ